MPIWIATLPKNERDPNLRGYSPPKDWALYRRQRQARLALIPGDEASVVNVNLFKIQNKYNQDANAFFDPTGGKSSGIFSESGFMDQFLLIENLMDAQKSSKQARGIHLLAWWILPEGLDPDTYLTDPSKGCEFLDNPIRNDESLAEYRRVIFQWIQNCRRIKIAPQLSVPIRNAKADIISGWADASMAAIATYVLAPWESPTEAIVRAKKSFNIKAKS